MALHCQQSQRGPLRAPQQSSQSLVQMMEELVCQIIPFHCSRLGPQTTALSVSLTLLESESQLLCSAQR